MSYPIDLGKIAPQAGPERAGILRTATVADLRNATDDAAITPFVLQEALNIVGAGPVLEADITWYVRTDGNDSNDGSTPGNAFRTVQAALNHIACNVNMGIRTATIDVGPGDFAAYTLQHVCKSGSIVIQGAGAATRITGTVLVIDSFVHSVLSNVTIAGGINVTHSARVYLRNITAETPAGSNAIYCAGGAISISGTINLVGDVSSYLYSNDAGQIVVVGDCNMTLSGTTSFGAVAARRGGEVWISGDATLTGDVTGRRWWANIQARIIVNGQGADYIPGTVAGGTGSYSHFE